MPISIGDKVIKRRKELKMTQSDLAKNICTQSQVSRIEKNEIMPSSETLFLMANKLNVSMDFFFGVEHVNNTIRGKKICEDYLESKEFEILEVFVDAQLQTVISEYEYKYFTWVKAVCSAYTKKNLQSSIDLLEELSEMKISVNDPELDASIHNSLSIFYRRTGNIEKADKLIQKARYIIKENSIFNETAIKVYYQYSALLANEENYKECLELATEGMNICIENNLLYLLEALIYMVCGAKHELKIISEKDRDLFLVGYNIAKLKNNIKMIELYDSELVPHYTK